MRGLRIALTSVLLACTIVGSALAQGGAPAAATSALTWVRAQQQPDGSFPGFGPGETADAIMAFVAAGEAAPQGAAAYLEGQAASYAASSVGAAAKLALAAVAAGADPTSFGSQNLLAQIGKSYDPASGQYGADVYGHALALLAIRAAGATPPLAATTRLLGLQLDDGGWSFDGTAASGSDTNTTSLVLQALVGQRQADGARAKAVTYLASQQNDDAGFPYSQAATTGTDSDANSTAAAIQALLAVGEDPAAAAWTKGGKTPLDALAAFQNTSGALRYQAAQADDNALATYQAVPALLGKQLPVRIGTVSGAQALVAPAAALPATATGSAPAALFGLALAALAALLGGTYLRRRAAR